MWPDPMYKNMSSDWTGPIHPPRAIRDEHNEILVKAKAAGELSLNEVAFAIPKKDRYIF